MKTISLDLYLYDELSDEAQRRARDWYREITASEGYPFSHDAIASLEAFVAYFGAKLTNYSIDFYDTSHSTIAFDGPGVVDLESLISGLRSDGSCQHTGYCADDDANEGAIRAFEEGERDPSEIICAGFRSWLRACKADALHLDSDEAVAEAIEANEYTFLENGSWFPEPS